MFCLRFIFFNRPAYGCAVHVRQAVYFLFFVTLVGDQTQTSANSWSAKWTKPPRKISSSTNYRSFFSSLHHISDNNAVLCSRCNFILGSVLKKIMLLLNFYFATSYTHWLSCNFPICFRIVGHFAFMFHWSVYGYLLFCRWPEPDWHRLSGVDIKSCFFWHKPTCINTRLCFWIFVV